MSAERLQIMREIDKLDKIGLEGVCKMLGDGMTDSSGAFNKGVGLLPIQVDMSRIFLESHDKTDDNNIIAETRRQMDQLWKIHNRINLMRLLEETPSKNGNTKWDNLFEMPKNENETWENGGRPANIGWALDDILEVALAVYKASK